MGRTLVRDSKNVTAVCDLPDTQEQRDALLQQWHDNLPRARKVAVEMALRGGGDRETIEDTLRMLGIHPDQGDDPLLISTDLGPGAALKDFNT